MTMVMENRSVPRVELRQRIYEAAIAEFRDKGYDRATVEAIARRAGVAKGTLFNFFPTKLDVLVAYYGELDARVAPLRKALDPKAPERSLLRYAAAVEKELRKGGDLVQSVIRHILAGGALREVDARSGDSDEQEFARFFARCKAQGTMLGDPQTAAAVVLDLWAGAVRRWVEGDGALAESFGTKLKAIFAGFGGNR